ncbi:MAG TPA: CAP domain-containing protein [Baekduia sp.]|nr:CAP domain-containing protein [Baekduia sp.]
MSPRPALILAVLLSAATVAAAPAAATARAATAAASVGKCAPSATWPANHADLADQVMTLVNAHRATLGLTALVVSPTLTAAATWKARHMAAYGYMDHPDPGPPVARTLPQRLAACGYSQATWGENIASGYATAQAVVNAWLSSPGHRANIERADFRATGVAAAGAPMYWSQTFGLAASTVAAASRPSPIRVSCAQHGGSIACSVRDQGDAMVSIALMRAGRTFARVRVRTTSDHMRVRLQAVRHLRTGRYALVVKTGTSEARSSLVVR